MTKEIEELLKEENLPQFLYKDSSDRLYIGWHGDSECGDEYKQWLSKVVIPLILTPSADVQERAKEYIRSKYGNPVKRGSVTSIDDVGDAYLADASSMQEELAELKAENERLIPYLRHLQTCSINQNWDEALQAMSDTPQQLRDEGYYLAQEEIERKQKTCTCGLKALTKQQ